MQLVPVVDLEDMDVIDLIFLEDLDAYSNSREDVTDQEDKAELVLKRLEDGVDELGVIVLLLHDNREEDHEPEAQRSTHKGSDYFQRVAIQDILIAFEVHLALLGVSIAELLRVDFDQVFEEWLYVFPLDECKIVKDDLQALVQDVVFQLEVLFHELLQNLPRCNLVDDGVGVQPLQSDIDLLECSLPVGSVTQFVLLVTFVE